jgi:hypothetical protein
LKEIATARQQLGEEQRQVLTGRARLGHLRRRLKQRWQRHWEIEQTALRRQQVDVAEKHRGQAAEALRLQNEKQTLIQTRLRLNAEMAVLRRQASRERELLRRYRNELQERELALDGRAAKLAEAERRLVEDQGLWQQSLTGLHQEAEGLETRICNYRRRVLIQEQELVRLERVLLEKPQGQGGANGMVPSPAATVSATTDSLASTFLEQREWQLSQHEAAVQERLAGLERLNGDLADQRLALVEECERLAQAQERLGQERETAAADLEALGRSLERREQKVQDREQALERQELESRQRAEVLAHLHRQLEAWKSRLTAGLASWEGERERLLTNLRGRELLLEERLAELAKLRGCWQGRRRRQLLRLRKQGARYEELRQECTNLRTVWLRIGAELEQEKRVLAERALALEQYRQEILGRSVNAAAAEKRMEQLRRRWATLAVAAQRTVAHERRRLQVKAAQLEAQDRELHTQAAEIRSQEADLSQRQSAWEQEQLSVATEHEKLRLELHSLRVQRQRYESQLENLRAEVEHLANLLLDESDGATPALVQAAELRITPLAADAA